MMKKNNNSFKVRRRKNKRKKRIGSIHILMLFFIFLAGIGLFKVYKSKEIKIGVPNIELKDKDMEELDTMHTISKNTENTSWNLTLVNPWNEISDNIYIPLATLNNGQQVDQRILPALQEMMDDARLEGLSPIICSGYRTEEYQTKLFNQKIQEEINNGNSEEEAREIAKMWVAVPGTSEHQLGVAVDIVDESNQLLNESQENTAVQQWLMKNCYKYGFILRYPKNKTNITGIGYEPWHYRYVGKKVAKEIMSRGITLEEYLNR